MLTLLYLRIPLMVMLLFYGANFSQMRGLGAAHRGKAYCGKSHVYEGIRSGGKNDAYICRCCLPYPLVFDGQQTVDERSSRRTAVL